MGYSLGPLIERTAHEQGFAIVANPEAIGEDYCIVSVEPAEAPGDLGGKNWYRYVIDQGENRICGYRQGSRQGVTKSIEEIVERLNERRMGPKGRVNLNMSTYGKPAAAK